MFIIKILSEIYSKKIFVNYFIYYYFKELLLMLGECYIKYCFVYKYRFKKR